MDRPTREGWHRYKAWHGYYRLSLQDGHRYPCRCEQWCEFPCGGECGCFACRIAASDARSLNRDKSPCWFEGHGLADRVELLREAPAVWLVGTFVADTSTGDVLEDLRAALREHARDWIVD